jgi:pimeloyl-ACP methyl ester carboxylesterase
MVSDRLSRRLALGLALVLVVAVGCSSGDDGADQPGGEANAAPGTTAPAPEPPFAVGHRAMELVDDSRPTDAFPPAGVEAAADRTVEVNLLYPAEGDAPAEDETVGSSQADAQPAQGPFPLLVFAHGFTSNGDIFVPYGEMWAREGYVVALPTFPLSQEGVGNSDDVQNQPGDVSFVIDQVLGFDGDDPLAGIADAEHIAVGGHSLGAATVFGVAYNTCCRDDRIGAAISVAGGGLPYDGGEYIERDTAPLLLVQGARDTTVPVGVGDATFQGRPAPITYLRFAEADHNNLFWGDDGPLLETAIVAFLDDQLKDDPSGMEALPGEVEASGRAVLRTK